MSLDPSYKKVKKRYRWIIIKCWDLSIRNLYINSTTKRPLLSQTESTSLVCLIAWAGAILLGWMAIKVGPRPFPLHTPRAVIMVSHPRHSRGDVRTYIIMEEKFRSFHQNSCAQFSTSNMRLSTIACLYHDGARWISVERGAIECA